MTPSSGPDTSMFRIVFTPAETVHKWPAITVSSAMNSVAAIVPMAILYSFEPRASKRAMTSNDQIKCEDEAGRTFRGTVSEKDVVQIRREAVPLLNVGLYRLTGRLNAP